MDINFFKGKKITVFGLGLHGGGVGVVKFLAGKGAKIIVTDIKSKEQLAPSLEKLKGLKNIEYVFGQHREEDFTQTDMVIKTPPVLWNNKYIQAALAKKIPVEMDSTLFFKLSKVPIIGITGTKGKTTTATLIYEILKLAGNNPIKVGVGQVSVLDKLEVLKKDSVAVFELSSWRLSGLGRAKMSPHIAVIKNILPDHLNYYKTIDEYLTDKENIFLYQNPKDFLIINEDDEKLRASARKAKSQVIKFSASPVKEGKGVYLEENMIYINNGVDIKKLIDIKEIKIPGAHNISNIMAAAGACYAFGVSMGIIQKAISEFKGIPHRLEFVREFQGVKYYNDTAATIPDAMLGALDSFLEPIILIAGGTDKKLDFTLAGRKLAQKIHPVRNFGTAADSLKFTPDIKLHNQILESNISNGIKNVVFLRGDATEKLILEICKNLPAEEKNREFEVVDSMEKAVEVACQKAVTGDIVLLSPGATSFGLFSNEFDRGEKFREAAKQLR